MMIDQRDYILDMKMLIQHFAGKSTLYPSVVGVEGRDLGGWNLISGVGNDY